MVTSQNRAFVVFHVVQAPCQMPRIAVNAALALLALWQLQGLHFAGHVLQELRPAMMEACVSSAKLVLLQGLALVSAPCVLKAQLQRLPKLSAGTANLKVMRWKVMRLVSHALFQLWF